MAIEMEREYVTVVLPEATKEDMLKSQYNINKGIEEKKVNGCCKAIENKLEKIDEWYKYKSHIKNGYKNRRK